MLTRNTLRHIRAGQALFCKSKRPFLSTEVCDFFYRVAVPVWKKGRPTYRRKVESSSKN